MTTDWSKTHFGLGSTPTGRCQKESDGYHAHVYSAWGSDGNGGLRRLTIEHHMHSWMDEHRQLHPGTRDVSANSYRDHLGDWDTVEEAWEALHVEGDVPPVPC